MFVGEYAFRDWLLFVLVAAVALVTGTDPLQVAIFAPAAWVVLGGWCVYGIGLRWFHSVPFAASMGMAWMGIAPYVGFQTSSFAAMLVVPLFVCVLAWQDGSISRRALLGVALGVAALSYIVAFAGCALILVLLFVTRTVAASHDGLPLWGRLVREVRWFLPVGLAAMPLALALWGPVLLVYGGHVYNPSHFYADMGHGWTLAQSLNVLGSLFLDFGNLVQFVLSLLTGIGVWAAWRQRRTHGGDLALLLLAAGLLGSYHFLLTMPLFGDHLVFFRFPKLFLDLAAVLLAFQALHWLAYDRLRGGELRPTAVAAVFLVVVLASAVMSPQAKPLYDANARVDDEPTQRLLSTAAWVRENLPKDAVVLSLDHEAFALNGLTGVKVVIERRTHANPFVDLDARYADAAIMLYSEDAEARRRLMDEYGVTHAYVGWFWADNEKEHPLVAERHHADRWRQAGLAFFETEAAYDPVGNTQRFPVIQVVPPAGPPPFLEDFEVIHRSLVDGEPWMTIYERKA